MNTVNVKTTPTTESPYKKGSIWKSKSGFHFILATVDVVGSGLKYAAISLEDGNRWIEPDSDISKSVTHLTLVATECEITITPKP